VTLRVMSFNVRVAGAPDGDNGWDFRRDFVIDTIRAADPDMLGAQECMAVQADFLRARLDDYERVGVHRDDGERRGEASLILFKRDRFDLLESGTFWLSDTPEAIGVKGWDAHLPRV
jgi:endonuclease/exonuclease/phosphatase family metal-dependent hydrolase